VAINIYKHCDSASAGGGDGSTWALAGANAAYTEAELEVFLEGAIEWCIREGDGLGFFI